MFRKVISPSANKETTTSMTQFRNDMDAVLDRVYQQHETFVIQKSGKPLAAIIHPRDLAYLYPQNPQVK